MCELSKRGIMAVQICSTPFIGLGAAQAKVFGVPNLPIVVIPHPLGGLSIEMVEARAQAALEQMIGLIEKHRK